jgi:topoisomerase-4 subunit B
MRLDPVILKHLSEIDGILSFYMGSNTPERQMFIIDNLRNEGALEPEVLEEVA